MTDFTLNSRFNLIISGKFTIEPSIEYSPSTITTIFFQGRWVLGWPWEMASFSTFLKSIMLLCLNTRTEAPERRTPKMIELWLSSSLMTKQPCRESCESQSCLYRVLTLLTRQGIVVEFVANPMETTIASSFPTKWATCFSRWRWMSSVPASIRVLELLMPYSVTHNSTLSAQYPSFCANPK